MSWFIKTFLFLYFSQNCVFLHEFENIDGSWKCEIDWILNLSYAQNYTYIPTQERGNYRGMDIGHIEKKKNLANDSEKQGKGKRMESER